MLTLSQDKPMAVLGAGNGGCALAADLASRGVAVNLFELPDFASGFQDILQGQSVSMQGACGTHTVRLNLATTDLQQAIAGVDFVHLVVPSTAQALFFHALAPVVQATQTVVIWAGRFGALELAHVLRQHRPDAPMPLIAETDTLPYGVRKINPASVRILYTATRLLVGTLPAHCGQTVATALRKLFPAMQAVDTVLAAALANPALVVYGIGALLNAARIEHMQGKFFLFAEGITPAVAAVMRDAYGEMTQVARAYGCEIAQFAQTDFDGPLSLEGACFHAPEGSGGFAAMDGPRDVRGRYMMENIGDALAPIAELGRLAGVTTPLLDALVTLGSSICATDFRLEGRNLARLGLAHASAANIQHLIQGKGDC